MPTGNNGNIPKRSGSRLGHVSNAEAAGEHVTKAPGAQKVVVPHASKDWCDMARNWYNALKISGQQQFYQPSDWQMAWLLADEIHHYKTATDQLGRLKRSPMMLASIMTGMSLLLTTEGDRRKVHIELQGAPEAAVDPGQVALEKYQEMLAKQKSA